MNELFDLLQTPVWQGVRVKHLLQLVVAFFVLRAVWRFVRGPTSVTGPNTADAACPCGWRGQASRHRPRCPRCGKAAILG